MAYQDPQFNVRYEVPVVFAAASGTATASGTNSVATAITIPYKPKRATNISAVRVRVTTAPAANWTALTHILKNGTATFATWATGTKTAGEWVDATVTAANAKLDADTQPTCDYDGTGTASAQTAGTFDIHFEVTEQFS